MFSPQRSWILKGAQVIIVSVKKISTANMHSSMRVGCCLTHVNSQSPKFGHVDERFDIWCFVYHTGDDLSVIPGVVC
jgi:hypothetical protein